MICGLRAWARTAASPIATIIPVLAIVVAGHNEFTAIGIDANSSAQPRVSRLSAYLPTVWPTWAPTHLGSRLSGGDTLTTWAWVDRRKRGGAASQTQEGRSTS